MKMHVRERIIFVDAHVSSVSRSLRKTLEKKKLPPFLTTYDHVLFHIEIKLHFKNVPRDFFVLVYTRQIYCTRVRVATYRYPTENAFQNSICVVTAIPVWMSEGVFENNE